MKKAIFSIALLIRSCTFAQTKELYHIYKFDGKVGVTDTLTNDVLPANYDGSVEELFGKRNGFLGRKIKPQSLTEKTVPRNT